MKKEMGKWTLDVAKYLATAVIISALFKDIQDKTSIVVIGIPSVMFIVIIGMLLIKEPKNKISGQLQEKN